MFAWVLLLGTWLIPNARLEAADKDKPIDPLSFDRNIEPMLGRLCYGCHNDDKTKGDVNLRQDHDLRQIVEHRKTWLTALKELSEKEMPPAKAKPQPTAEERDVLIRFIDKTVNSLDCTHVVDPGKPLARRLNRSDYANAMRDLLGVDVDAAATLPADGISYGFDDIGDALSMSPLLVDRYYDAARRALDALWRDPGALARIIPPQPADQAGEAAAARSIIAAFAMRAYRKPVPAGHLDKLMGIFAKARAKSARFTDAVRPMLEAVLISPRFLVRIEDDQPDAAGAYAVSAYDLASRLSFFLWSGPPDPELIAAAASGAILKSGEIERQAKRMLADPRASALAENFFGQWLQIRSLEDMRPDQAHFPEFTPTLKKAFAQEAALFIGEIVHQDHPITDLLDADYTYLNEELAHHYGIRGVTGTQMRRVALADHRRGGVVTMGALLTVTSDPTRTNIPRRGNYLMGTILGTPPPPPPAMVPPLEQSTGTGAPLTVREMLEIHRRKPECAVCHAKIDPLGFSLDNFNAIGTWQDQEAGKPVDASGVLPSGESFSGPIELKKILIARTPSFAKTLSEQMLIYALGRGLIYQDDCVIKDAQAALARDGYRFSSLVLTVVASFPFTHRRNPDF
jgi:hypothetical protein